MNAVLLLMLAADLRGPPGEASSTYFATSVRLHLRASEELDPDYLRALARPRVTLWLSTRSNTLRESTLETINKFDQAWISLRAPVRESDALQLAKVPKAGLWIDFADLDRAQRVLGPRRLAINLRGALDLTRFQKLQKLRPAETIWSPPPDVDLLSWGLFRQLPGRKLLARAPSELSPVDCPADPGDGEPTLQTRFTALLLVSSIFPCGRGRRIEVPLEVERVLLHNLLLREPSTELAIEIGDDPMRVSKARRLLDDLGLK